MVEISTGNQRKIKSPLRHSPTVMCVSVCLSDPVSSSLVQSVMSMASSHSQHSHISTDTMSSMSGSYLAGAEGEPGDDEGGDAEGEENQDAPMESRGPSQQHGVRNPGVEGWRRNWLQDPNIYSKHVVSSLDCLPLYLFFHSGVFPGAKGTKLLSGCRGAGLRGELYTDGSFHVFI